MLNQNIGKHLAQFWVHHNFSIQINFLPIHFSFVLVKTLSYKWWKPSSNRVFKKKVYVHSFNWEIQGISPMPLECLSLGSALHCFGLFSGRLQSSPFIDKILICFCQLASGQFHGLETKGTFLLES